MRAFALRRANLFILFQSLSVGVGASSTSANATSKCVHARVLKLSPVVYIHVPKASGSSVQLMLTDFVESVGLSPAVWVRGCDVVRRNVFSTNPELHYDLDAIMRKNRLLCKHTQPWHYDNCICSTAIWGGHIPTWAVRLLYTGTGVKPRYMITMRDPIAGELSKIRFIHKNLMTIDDVIAKVTQKISQGLYASVTKHQTNYHAAPWLSVDPLDYTQARRALNMFSVIALTENFDTARRMIQRLIDPANTWNGWRSNMYYTNKSPGNFPTSIVLQRLPASKFAMLRESYYNETQLYISGLRAHNRICVGLLDTTRAKCHCVLRDGSSDGSNSNVREVVCSS